MSAFKAQAHMRELKQRLGLLISGAVFTDALDADGFPQLNVAAGGESIFIAIVADGNAGRVDGLGLAQRVYSPHICQLLEDATPSDNGVRAKVMAACAKLGMKLQLWEIAGIGGSFTLAGASMTAEIRSDEINPLTTSQ